MHRIYFDTNSGTPDGRYDLGIEGSLRDIEPIADLLRDGLRVVLYMTGELEMEAVLEWDPAWGGWTAHADDSTLKHYPEAILALERLRGGGETMGET